MNTRSPGTQKALPLVCALAALLGAAGSASAAAAGGMSSVADDVAMVQPFIGETTAIILKIDPARVSLPDLTRLLKAPPPGSEEAFRAWTREAAGWIAAFRTAAAGQAVYATVGMPVSKSEYPAFLLLRQTPEVDRKRLLKSLNAAGERQSCVRDGVIVVMPGEKDDAAAAIAALDRAPRTELADAFRAVEKYPFQALLLPPQYVRQTVVELLPKLPRQLGGGSSDVLTQGVVWAALGLDLQQLRGELIVKSASQKAARDLAEQLPRILRSAHETLPEFKRRFSQETLELLLAVLAFQMDDDRLVVRFDGSEPTGRCMRLAAMAAAAAGERIVRQKNTDRFKRILLAMHQHHDAYKAFPPGDEVPNRSTLSWRVHLLPFLDQAALYKEFHLDEPWDSAHNKRLIEKMPDAYKSGWFGIAPGHTTFLAPVGEDTVFGGQKGTKISEITDGTSNTLILVEVKPQLAVPWTAPQDYAFDPKAPAQGLQVGAGGRFLAGLADGSVQQLRADAKPEVLLRFFRKSDGQPVDWQAVR